MPNRYARHSKDAGYGAKNKTKSFHIQSSESSDYLPQTLENFLKSHHHVTTEGQSRPVDRGGVMSTSPWKRTIQKHILRKGQPSDVLGKVQS